MKTIKQSVYFLIIFLLMSQHPESNKALVSSGVIGNDYDILSTFMGLAIASLALSMVMHVILDMFNDGYHELWPLVKFSSVVLFWPTGFLVIIFGDPVYLLIKKHYQKSLQALENKMA